MEDHDEDRSAPLVAGGSHAIDFTFFCVHCGYNLRGLFRDGRCPECGELVSDSSIDDALHVSDPEWLRAITRGATFLYAGCLVFVAAVILAFLPLFFLAGGAVGTMLALGLGTAVMLVLPLLSLAGVILLTRPEPRVALIETRTAWRPLCRWSVIALVAAMLAGWLIDSVPLTFAGVEAQVLLGSIVGVFRTVTICAFVICLTRYSAQLALRGSYAKLAQSVRRRGTGFVVCYAVAGAFDVIDMWLSRGGPGPQLSPTTIGGYGMWETVALGLVRLGIFAYSVGLMSAIGLLRRVLKKCMADASKHSAIPGS